MAVGVLQYLGSEIPIVQKPIGPKANWSESLLVQKLIGPIA